MIGSCSGRFVELGGVGRSPEVNEEAGRAKFVPIIGNAGVGGEQNGKKISTN